MDYSKYYPDVTKCTRAYFKHINNLVRNREEIWKKQDIIRNLKRDEIKNQATEDEIIIYRKKWARDDEQILQRRVGIRARDKSKHEDMKRDWITEYMRNAFEKMDNKLLKDYNKQDVKRKSLRKEQDSTIAAKRKAEDERIKTERAELAAKIAELRTSMHGFNPSRNTWTCSPDTVWTDQRSPTLGRPI
jgi:hypothetical protein